MINLKKIITLLFALVNLSVFLTACSSGDDTSKFNPFITPQGPQDIETLKVGFIYDDSIYDESYTKSHENARKALMKQTNIKTEYIESVPVSDFKLAVDMLVKDGCNIIISTNSIYSDAAFDAAQSYKNIWFFSCGGLSELANLACFEARMYEPAYICGNIAALHTFTGKVGIVSDRDIYARDAVIDAFAFGLQKINPEATVELVYAVTAEETQAAVDTLEQLGCDVIAQYQNKSDCIRYCNNKGIKVIGSNIYSYGLAPATYLLSYVYSWENYYVEQINKIIDGTWVTSKYVGGMVDGMSTISELSPNCATSSSKIVNKMYSYVMNGTIEIFKGPIADSNGNEVVLEGTTLTHEFIPDVSFLVKGVNLQNNYIQEQTEVTESQLVIKTE